MDIIAAILATLFAGVVRTSVGVGAGIFLTACLSLLFQPKMTLAVIAFVQIGLGITAIRHYWGTWDRDLVLKLVVVSFFGAALGSWLVTLLPPTWLHHIFGAVILGFAILELIRPARALPSTVATHNLTFGFATGLAGSMANAAGAVLALYLKRLGLNYLTMMGTLSAVVFATDISRLFLYWHFEVLNMAALRFSLLLMPVIFTGGWIGVRIRDQIPESILRRVILSLIVLIGTILLV